jgi:hypothetical protein
MTQKPMLWVEVGKSACVLVGFANCASLRLLDMTRKTLTFGLSLWVVR